MYKKSSNLFRAIILFILVATSVGSVSAKADEQVSISDCPPFNPSLMHNQEFQRTLSPECRESYIITSDQKPVHEVNPRNVLF